MKLKKQSRSKSKRRSDGGGVFDMFSSAEQKDVNEMILHGEMTADEITEVINTNTYSGMEAKLKFSTWKKL